MRLAEYLDQNDLTNTAFARLVGVKPAAVSKWLRGTRPDWPQLLRIRDATGGAVTPNDFLPAETGEAPHLQDAAE